MPKTDNTNADRQQRWRDRQKANRGLEEAQARLAAAEANMEYAHRGPRKPGASGYKGGCRCAACRQGQRDKIASQRDRRSDAVTVAPAVTIQIAVAPADQVVVTVTVPDPRPWAIKAAGITVEDYQRCFMTDLPAPGPDWRIWRAKGYSSPADYSAAAGIRFLDRDTGICYHGPERSWHCYNGSLSCTAVA